MKIGILETGRPPEDLMARHGDYPRQFERLLSGHGFTFEAWAVLDMQFPASVDDADGWLITGSRFGVYEDHPWIPPLKDFIRAIHAAGKPLVGVCFGHQIMAEALGGRAEKSARGWGAGHQEYTAADGSKVTLNAFHQDQVTVPPPGATTVAASPFCAHAALAYRDNMVSIQPHPEFTDAYMTDLIEARRGILPPGRADEALASVDGGLSLDWAVRMMTDALHAGRDETRTAAVPMSEKS